MMLLRWKALSFILPLALSAFLAGPALLDLLRASRSAGYYSHILFVPLVSAYIFFRRRRRIFQYPGPPCLAGAALVAGGIGFYFALRPVVAADVNDGAAAAVFSGLLVLYGAFLFLFGWASFKKAYFPLALLFFTIPIPAFLIEGIIRLLVAGSGAVTQILFEVIGVPFFRNGSIFDLPAFSLEVASECSGIRSSFALFIVAILAGHLFLAGLLSKVLLTAAVFPITIFKNGLRIVTLYLLSYFVDMRIIDGGFLHRSGGFIFFGMGLILLGGTIWLLRKVEVRRP